MAGKKKLNNIIIHKKYAEIEINSKVYGKQNATIDVEDVDKIKNTTWHIHATKLKKEIIFYVQSQKGLLLHRVIMNNPKNKQIDHINHNPLDNRKCNLKVCTSQENCLSRRINSLITIHYNNYHKLYVARYQKQNLKFERASKIKDVAIQKLKDLLAQSNIFINEVFTRN